MSNFEEAKILPDLSKLTWLQGSAADLTHDIQVMLMIQPNCPGCHMHAIPLANKLMQSKHDFDVYCISTAFEDFEFNTEEMARLLILHGKHVGAAKAQLGETVKHVPSMPFAHDIVVATNVASKELKDFALEASKNNARKQMEGGSIPSGVLEMQLSNVGYEVLPAYISEYFWTVNAMGTPTWVVHKANGEILGQKFGQLSEVELLGWIETVKPR
jgi:hypothetical protein